MPDPIAQKPPAAAPQPDQEPPAAPGTGTDTPEAHSGAEGLILGRAWMDRQGGVYDHGIDQEVREWLNEPLHGPLREVLLVDPAAGPALEAALAWRAASLREGVYAEHVQALAAAVDAATSGQPTANLAVASRGLADEGMTESSGHAAGPIQPLDLTDAERAEALAVVESRAAYCVQTTDNDMQAFVELPDCEACDGSGKQVPPGFYGGPQPASNPCPRCDREDGHGGPCATIAAPEPAGDVDKLADMVASSPETWRHITDRFPGLAHQIERVIDPELRAAPELASDGPGWDRAEITYLANLLDRAEAGRLGDSPNRQPGDQLRALLADRDRLAEQIATLDRWLTQRIPSRWHSGGAPVEIAIAMLSSWSDRGKLATELAEVTTQAEAAYRAMVEAERQRDEARAGLDGPCRPDCDCPHEPMHVCYCHMTRDQLIQEIDQREEQRDEARDELAKVDAVLYRHGIHHPGGSQGVLDLAGLLVDAKEEAETARRYGAADALEEAADDLAGPPPEVERSVLQRLRLAAAEVRSGEREIPARQDGDS